MAEADSWPSVRTHGLLSVTALLDLFEVDGAQREKIESQHRPECVPIKHPIHGRAVIRDQKPMSESALRKCLIDMTPEEWYRCLNRRVFFWVSKERVERLLGARAYRNLAHCVITADTAAVVRGYHRKITLGPINSGSTIFNPQPRGSKTFLPISEYPFEDWVKRRGAPRNAVVELAVDYAVPDMRDHTIKVEVIRGGRVLKRLYEK
jgi:Family of unknown function (DUF7002)